MKHIHYLNEKTEEITESGATGITLRTVIGERDGAPNFSMRIISFEQGGRSPNHSHNYEHEIYVMNGCGTVEVDGKIADLRAGDIVYVPPNTDHCFKASDPMEIV